MNDLAGSAKTNPIKPNFIRLLPATGEGGFKKHAYPALRHFSYDGYGVLLQKETEASAKPGHTPAQETSLLYAGEQFDVDAQSYYLRARYYNPSNGLFNRTDPFAGNNQDPQSLHKYLYCHANPINGIDPSGQFTLTNVMVSMAIAIAAIALPALNMLAMTLFALPGEDEDSSGYVASITLSGTVLNAGGWPGLAGIGGELSSDFVYIKSKGRWYDYIAGGLMVGLSGYSLSVEAGPVYRVEEVENYEKLFLTTSFGGTKGIFKPFAGLISRAGISPGMSGALFWSPLGERPYGYKVGGMLSSSSAVWGFTAAWYWAGPFAVNKPILDFLNTYVAPPQGDTAAEARQFSENLHNEIESLL